MARKLAVALALLILAASPAEAAPRVDPEVEATLRLMGSDRPDEWKAELARLAEQDRPGVRLFYEGMLALRPGDGAKAGWTTACAKWEEAAPLLAQAAHFAAECYEQAYDGRPQDIPRALGLYALAAEAGYGKSWCAQGNIHAAGKGVPEDKSLGVAMCARGAEMGDRDAQTDLGTFYLMGDGVPRDPVAARDWFEKAAPAGNRNAAFLLGQIYWKGDGVARDKSAAAKWWKLAYDLGRKDAAPLLAREALVRGLVDGRLVPEALREAEGWYVRALELELPATEKAELERDLAVVRRALAEVNNPLNRP